MSEPAVASVRLTRRGAQRWKRGHPWIFRDDVRPGAEPENGSVVAAQGPGGEPLGQGFWSARSKIALRMITRRADPLGRAFWGERLAAAVAYREIVARDSSACRLVSADADGIPGLIVDRYGPHLVIQLLIPGTEALRADLTGLACELLAPRSILARNDVAVRELEGLPRTVEQLLGETPHIVEVAEGPVRYLADLHRGQKTGAFLDQRENRLAASFYTGGRVLDLFCYHGSFALHADARAESVVAVDSSAAALARGRENAALNGLGRIEFVEANAFDFLKACDRSGERFDTIFMDPPAFAKSRADVPAAKRAYKEINLRALRILRPGGFLVTCSCSYNLSEPAFIEIIEDAAADAGRRLRVVERRGASRDHPVLLGLPESRYLKCLILQA